MKDIKEYINEAYQATYLKRWQPIEKLYDKRHIDVGDDRKADFEDNIEKMAT